MLRARDRADPFSRLPQSTGLRSLIYLSALPLPTGSWRPARRSVTVESMPVEFLCPGCRATLSVARRKIGLGTECPRCAAQLVVPDEVRARTEVTMARLARSARKQRRTHVRPELSVTGDTPADESSREDAWPVADSAPRKRSDRRIIDDAADDAPPVVIAEPPPVALWRTDARPELDVHGASFAARLGARRRARVGQIALCAAIAAATFVLGFALARTQQDRATALPGANDPVLIEGRITFSDSSGATRGDAGALVLAVPVTPLPSVKLRPLSLHSSEASLADADAKEFARVGAAMARADENGAFTLVVPRPDAYRLLWISRQTSRPSDQMPAPSDLETLADYFAAPIDLIGLRQYALATKRVDPDDVKLEYEF